MNGPGAGSWQTGDPERVRDFIHLKAGRTAASLRADIAAPASSGTLTTSMRSTSRSPVAGGCGHNFISPSFDARRPCAGLSFSASAMGCDRVRGDGGDLMRLYYRVAEDLAPCEKTASFVEITSAKVV